MIRPHGSGVLGASPNRLDLDAPLRSGGLETPQQAALDLQRIQALSGIGPVFITDPYAPGTATPLLYEDSASTTVAAVGSVVGLLLDVSKGLVLGPELVGDPDLDNADYWTKSAECTVSGGLANIKSTTGNAQYIYKNGVFTTGRRYRVTVEVTRVGSGGIILTDWVLAPYSNTSMSTPRMFVFDITATSKYFVIQRNISVNGGVADIDVAHVSVREVLGTHALQSTTANKSTLRVTPSTNVRWLDANTATAAMTVTLPSAITNATTFVATPAGVVKTTGVNLGTSFSITSPYQWFSGYVAIDAAVHGATTPAEDALITRFLSRYVPALGNEIIKSPDFTNATPWELQEGWSISNNLLVGDAVEENSSALETPRTGLIEGNTYIVSTDVVSLNGSVFYGSSSPFKISLYGAISTTGTHVHVGVIATGAGHQIRKISSHTVSISRHSIKQIL